MKEARAAFTLIELLVVIAIISVLAAILTPVFTQARGSSYQSACVSNQRQLGLAVLQYAQDYDEMVPNGSNINLGQRMWAGEGWGGQCFPYVRNAGVYRCPADSTPVRAPQCSISYGYNYNMVAADDYEDDDIPPGITLAGMTSPSRSVMLFEVAGVTVNITDPREGADSGRAGTYFSASGNGLDNRLYAHKDWTTGVDNTYATGYLGGRLPFDPSATQFPEPGGRHHAGATYLLCDGHARWLPGSLVSSGLNAMGEQCLQDNTNNAPGCGGQFYAAGTAVDRGVQATFTTR